MPSGHWCQKHQLLPFPIVQNVRVEMSAGCQVDSCIAELCSLLTIAVYCAFVHNFHIPSNFVLLLDFQPCFWNGVTQCKRLVDQWTICPITDTETKPHLFRGVPYLLIGLLATMLAWSFNKQSTY